MKKCEKYEDALYYDCIECDEDCKFRKEHSSFDFFVIYLIFIIAIILLLL